MATFTITGRLPSANELLRWDRIVGRRGPRRFYGSVKRRRLKLIVAGYIWEAKIPKFIGPVEIAIKWVEPNARRDYDNISSGVKLVLDSLVDTQTIGGDSRRWIPNPVNHKFAVDKKNPRIEVTIEEAYVHDFSKYPVQPKDALA